MKLPPKFKFIYLKDPADVNHRVTSVGVTRVGTDYHVQIARCRPPDNFCRKIARDIIVGRYKKHGPIKAYMVEAYPTLTELYDQIDFDWNPETGNEIVDSQFALAYDE